MGQAGSCRANLPAHAADAALKAPSWVDDGEHYINEKRTFSSTT
jgi:hypothetical protein